MLDAFIKKRVRRILDGAGNTHANDKNEDAITSMIFSPLRFMEPHQALDSLYLFLRPELAPLIGSRRVTSFDLDLWPQGLRATSQAALAETRCEPDLVAKIAFDEAPQLIVIGEVKWDWYPTGDDLKAEMKRERAALKAPNVKLFSFALVKGPKNSYEGLGFPVLTWAEFHKRLHSSLPSPGLSRACRVWMEQVSRFLTIAEQTIFTGIELSFAGLPDLGAKPIFYRTGFRGFSISYGEIPSGPKPWFYGGRN